jgi:hypothetical protein
MEIIKNMKRHPSTPKSDRYRTIIVFIVLLIAIVLLSVFLSNQQAISAEVTEGSIVITLVTSLLALWAALPRSKDKKNETTTLTPIEDNTTWHPLPPLTPLPSLFPLAPVHPIKRRVNSILLVCIMILVAENVIMIYLFYSLHHGI